MIQWGFTLLRAGVALVDLEVSPLNFIDFVGVTGQGKEDTLSKRRQRAHSRKIIPPWTPCGYCFQEWANSWDHILPVSERGRNGGTNLFPCCKRCNSILNSKVFDTLEEKRAYIRERLVARGEWITPSSNEIVPLEGRVN